MIFFVPFFVPFYSKFLHGVQSHLQQSNINAAGLALVCLVHHDLLHAVLYGQVGLPDSLLVVLTQHHPKAGCFLQLYNNSMHKDIIVCITHVCCRRGT